MNFYLKNTGFFILMSSASILLRKLIGSVANILEDGRAGFSEDKFFILRSWCNNMTYFLFALIIACTIFYVHFLWKDGHPQLIKGALFAGYIAIAAFFLTIPIY